MTERKIIIPLAILLLFFQFPLLLLFVLVFLFQWSCRVFSLPPPRRQFVFPAVSRPNTSRGPPR